MKRSSSDTVDENPWTDVQQEPAKKAKPDDVCLIIEPTGDLLEGENGENGHNNSGENGHHNGDAVAHENNGTQHVEENGQFVQENNGYVAEVEANGSADVNGESSIFETKENGAAATDGTETEEDQPMRADEEEILKSEEIAVEEESIELRISEEQETESNDAVIVSEPIEESTIKLAPSEGTWNQRLICVSELPGHSFKVNAVDMVGNILVSASDDTTIKSWNLETKSEICTLSGHKESVKAVRVLDLAASKDFAEDGNVVISGSADCCAKFWHVPSGKELKSIYTFNAINCIGYIPFEALLVTGTEGGKLQLFDAKTGTSLCSILAFELPVISMKVCGDMIICGDPQGRLQVWIVKDRKLHCRRTSNAMETSRPSMSAIAFYGTDNIVAGLLSGSIKKMSWVNGSVNKLRSGSGDQIDALEVVNELLVFTTSNDDKSFLHFFNLPTGVYLGSVEGKNQMTSVAAVRKDGFWHVATGGEKLHLWVCGGSDQNELDEGVAGISLLPQADTTLEDSDSEGEEEDEELAKKEEKPSSRCCVM